MGVKLAIAGVAAVILIPMLIVAVLQQAVSSLFGGPTTNQSTATTPIASTTPGDCVVTGASTGGVAGYTADQIANAATIVAVGRQLAVPPAGWVIAVATALQESGLRNLNHGDRDSLGLFQQRPSQGWGSPTQILDPTYAATQFYRHLLAVPGWQQMPLTQAAQAVQRSAFPNAYAAREAAARQIVAFVGTASCADTVSAAPPVIPPQPRAPR